MELFYVAADGSMMAAKITVVSGRMTAEPKRLFDANLKLHTNYDANFAVSSDGQRFLGIARESRSGKLAVEKGGNKVRSQSATIMATFDDLLVPLDKAGSKYGDATGRALP